tara:strand:+ start:182 stop:397 length:216 start_codon:yes stop_codon:yes gene_type:complete
VSSIRKLTPNRLKQIIKEEKEKVLKERAEQAKKEERNLLEALIMYKTVLSEQNKNDKILKVLKKYINKRRK